MAATRRIYVGDVQGCREPLERLLAKVRVDPASDRVLCAGDLVNRGPDSAGVLRLHRTLGAASVLGNHDLYLLDVAAGRARASERVTFGDVLGADDRDELIAWLDRRPLAVVSDDVVLVHAALRPTWRDLETLDAVLTARRRAQETVGRSAWNDDDVRFAVSARFTTPDGRQPDQDWPPPGPPFVNWVDLWKGPRTVVFGHFARQGLLVRPFARGIDTGCVYGGRLTAWIAEEDRLESVPRDR